jgi:hypothetical protein
MDISSVISQQPHNLVVGQPKVVNYTQDFAQDIIFEAEAKSISDILSHKFRSLDDGIHAVSNALSTKSNRSLLEMAKIFENESLHIKNLTNITEKDRASRLELLEKGFAEAAYWLFFEPALSSHNMDFLVNFATNAAQNIDITGLKDETKNLLFEGLSRAVSGAFHSIQNKAINEAIQH